MEPNYTNKDEIVKTQETSEGDAIPELVPNQEFGPIVTDNETLPEATDSVVLPGEETPEDDDEPKETIDMNQIAD